MRPPSLLLPWLVLGCVPEPARTRLPDLRPTNGVSPDPVSAGQVEVAHPRELRGVWVASLSNINWPSRPGLSSETQKQEFRNILDAAYATNLNAVLLQVRPEGDALYKSDLEPWSHWLSGRQGAPPEPFYDPLAFATAEAHAHGLELHAWINPYRARSASSYARAGNHVSNVLGGAARRYGDLTVMDPGAREVQDHTLRVVMDIVERYDVDGIHFDDYFYPYPKPGISFPDESTYQAYRAGGGTLARDDWRRDNVNQFIARVSAAIRARKPHVRFGISPFGIYRPGEPPGTEGALDQYGSIFADPKRWLEQGWVDYLAPQLYWSSTDAKYGFERLLRWWVGVNPRGLSIFPGINLSKAGSWGSEEYRQEIAIARSFWREHVNGMIFYHVGPMLTNAGGMRDRFAGEFFPGAVLPPVSSLAGAREPAGMKAELSGRMLHWQFAGEVRKWTLYRREGGAWVLDRILRPNVREASLTPGTWALAAVDRHANETLGRRIDVEASP